jgi:hypothetical protein
VASFVHRCLSGDAQPFLLDALLERGHQLAQAPKARVVEAVG